MNDLAVLGLAVDSRQVAKGAEDLDKLTAAAAKAEKAADNLGDAVADAGKGVKTGTDKMKEGLEDVNEQAQKTKEGLKTTNDTLGKTGQTAKQTAAALRGVPAQFSDIVVSLQGGQAPLTVFLQQGSQLRDMFGGAGAAAKALGGYIAGLITPATGAAAAAAALGVAYYQGSQEVDAFNKALALTGNSVGLTTSQLADMAKQVGTTVGTTHQAADVLAQLAGSGQIASSSLEEISKATLSFSKATGTAIEDVVAQYVKLAKDPTKASAELNTQLNYLTAATYQQIQAMQESGNMAGAQALAFQEFSQAQTESSARITENLGYIQTGWNNVKSVAGEAWDVMLGLGREDTLDATLTKIQDKLSTIRNAKDAPLLLGDNPNLADLAKGESGFQADWTKALQNEVDTVKKAREDMFAGQNEKAAIEAWDSLHQQYLQGLDKEAKQTIELTKLDAKRAAALQGQGANALQIEKEYTVARQGIIDKYKDKTVKAANPLDLTSFNDAQNALKLLTSNYDNAEKQLEASQRAGTISSEAYYSQRVDLINKEKTDVTAAYQQEIIALEAIKGKSTTTGQQRIQLDQRIADARANMVKAQQDADGKLAILATNERARLDQSKAALEAYTAALNQNLESLKAQGDREAALVGLGQHQKDMFNKLADQERDYNRERLDLAKQYANGTGKLSEKEYNDRLNALDNYYRNAVQVVYDNEAKIQQAQSNWANGANAAWQDYLANARDIAGQTYNAFSDAFRSMEDALVNFVMTGKASFDDFVKSVIAGVLRIQAQKLIIGVGSSLGFGSSAFGSTGGGAAGSGYSLSDLYSMGTGAYNFVTGTGANLYSAYQAGGLGGVWNYGSSAISGAFGGGASAGAGYGIGQPLVTGSVGNAGYAASTGLLGSGVSGATAGLYGIGGALYGYQQSGLKGAIAGGLGAAGGAVAGGATAAALGAAAGSIIPGIGTAIGAALGGLLGGSLFGGKWQTKDVGLSLGVSGGDLDAQQYEYQKKKGGLFGKNKSRYRYSELDDETAAALQATYDATEGSVLTLFKQLGIDGADALATSFTTGIRVNVQTSGKTEEEINQALTEWFGSIQENMVDVINGVAGSPFQNLDFAGLQELAVDLTGVNSILTTLHRSTLDISANGALAAKALVDIAGGLDALTANANTYYQNFFTEAERNENYLKDMRKQFEALGIAMPATRDAFRQTVDALDLTTTTGQQMFATLTALSGNAAAAYSILEQQAAAAQQAMTDAANAAAEAAQAAAQAAAEAAAAAKQVLVDSVTSAFTALQRAITAEQQKLTDAYNARVASLNDMVSTANSNISTLTQLSGSLHSALQQLRGASDTSGMAYQSATAQLRKALSGGSLVGADLNDAISAVTGNTSDRYTNWQDFARDQGRSANLLEALEGKTNGQLTTQEKTLATLEKQLAQAQTAYDAEMGRLQGQLDLAQAQIDAINGVDNTVLSVVDAVNRLHASIIALSPNGTGGMNADQLVKSTYKAVLGRDADAAGLNYWKGQLSSGAVSSNDLASAIRGSANQNGELIRNLYQQILGRAPDAAGMSYWQNAVASGSVTDLIAAFKAAAKSAGEIPGFARGGSFEGGARIVGENGPELEVTGPSRIYSHSETKNMFSSNNADLVAEVRALRQEIANQTNLQSQITRNTAKTARYTQQMNEVGLPAMES